MAVRNLYPNLPGHLVEFKDGGLQVSTNNDIAGYDKSLLILGTALDGPVNEPVKIDPVTVTQVFGSEVNDKGYPNGATLTKYAKQAFRNGFSDVRCMRVTGKQAFVEIVKSHEQQTETVEAKPILKTISGTDKDVSFSLNCLPVTNPPAGVNRARLKLVQTNGGKEIEISLGGSASGQAVTYGDYDGNIVITAGKLSKHPSVRAEYFYKEVSDANGVINDFAAGQNMNSLNDYHIISVPDPLNHPTEFVVNKVQNAPITRIREVGGTSFETGNVPLFDGTSGLAKAYEIDVNPSDANDPTYLYVTPYTMGNPQDNSGKLPITEDGAVMVLYLVNNDGTETKLTLGTDYSVVNGNQISFTDTTAYLPDDEIRVEYFTYKIASATDTFNNLNSSGANADTDDVVTIKPIPADNKVVIKDANGNEIPASDYTVQVDDVEEALNVIFAAGSFLMGTELTIEYELQEVISENESFTVVAKNGGKAYNDSTVTITEEVRDGEVGRRYTFTKPDSKLYGSGDKPFYFTSFDCTTVGELKIALSRYALNNVFDIIADNEDLATNDFPLSTNILAGGDDGINVTNNEMFEALSGKRNEEGYLTVRGAYQILENYHCDYIYVAGIYADSAQTVNKYSSFHHELALLCAVLTYRTKMTHGFIDVKPNSNTTLVGIQKYVDKLTAMENLHYMRDSEGNDIVDSDGNKMDIGWYTSVVVGPDPVMVSDKLGTYYGSAAIAYAALCASLKPQSAPTNKALPGCKGLKYRLSNKQMNELVGNRMVCFRIKNEGVTTASSTPYCVDGVTAGAPLCDYTRMSTVKVVTDVVDQIREVAEPFIGEPNTVEQRNALAALISKRLSFLMEGGEIQYYEFEINATIQQVLLGECTIALTLVPPMELRKITTVVSLRAAA